ncbi:hypothetical protein [Adhaeribacter soli]|uniref:Uncharacterized protein n=1 Tax=Adhaeribacter soli TaxID=2607655 RepID=A0A5N1J1H6_9BACT|nr:hypothetical protein [Adhaeribacter soli]KAA9340258.1 hypothetical protein F0P94_07890 [Adhaeribacter soli]
MTIKEVITRIINRNKEMLNFLDEEGGRDYSNDVIDKIALRYVDLLQKWDFNAGLGTDFSSVLLLLNDEAVFSQFDLQDVRELLGSLIELQKFNIDNYLELAHFEYAIMDNNQEAKKIILEGIEKAKQKGEELERLLKIIEKEK